VKRAIFPTAYSRRERRLLSKPASQPASHSPPTLIPHRCNKARWKLQFFMLCCCTCTGWAGRLPSLGALFLLASALVPSPPPPLPFWWCRGSCSQPSLLQPRACLVAAVGGGDRTVACMLLGAASHPSCCKELSTKQGIKLAGSKISDVRDLEFFSCLFFSQNRCTSSRRI